MGIELQGPGRLYPGGQENGNPISPSQGIPAACVDGETLVKGCDKDIPPDNSHCDPFGDKDDVAWLFGKPRRVQPVELILAPTGSGKTTTVAEYIRESGEPTIWLCNRHDDADAVTPIIEATTGPGSLVGKVVSLRGKTKGVRNCLFPEQIEKWQEKGYTYRVGFCRECCQRMAGELEPCPFLQSIDNLAEHKHIVVTKSLARSPGFFSQFGNEHRGTVVVDEDPIGLLRPVAEIKRDELEKYIEAVDRLIAQFTQQGIGYARIEAEYSRHVAMWCWEQVRRQQPNSAPEPVEIPADLLVQHERPGVTKRMRTAGRNAMRHAFYELMRGDPDGTIRNVYRDLCDLVSRANGQVVFVNSKSVLFHLKVIVPKRKRLILLDATADAELLRPLFAPRLITVLADQKVEPKGRIIQLMDMNGPRSYLNKTPKKLLRIIDAIGNKHPHGKIVLIAHKSNVEQLREVSVHRDRIIPAHYGALRGRNDLESSPDNPIACHIVCGSPKHAEEHRQQLALAVYGAEILPFPKLKETRIGIRRRFPAELSDGQTIDQIWEVRCMGYDDERMQRIYNYTVTAELMHAADRARVLIHPTTVYLVTNEPIPGLWFAEGCFAGDILELNSAPRTDFERNYLAYEQKARQLLDAGEAISNADVCRALEEKPGWGKRYWKRFVTLHRCQLSGKRKVRWAGQERGPGQNVAAIPYADTPNAEVGCVNFGSS